MSSQKEASSPRSVMLPDAVWEYLNGKAKEAETSVNAVIRQALRAHFGKDLEQFRQERAASATA